MKRALPLILQPVFLACSMYWSGLTLASLPIGMIVHTS